MIFLKPFKLHYFSYRKIFLIAFVLEVLAALAIIFVFKDVKVFYPFIVVFLVFLLILSFVFGFYEYNHLCDHYFNFKTNRLSFFVSSLLFGIINALFKTMAAGLLFYGLFKTEETLNSETLVSFPYLKVTTFLLIFALNVFVYLFASFLALILRKTRFGRPGFYVLTFLTVSLFFQNIYAFLQAKTIWLFTSPML
ncbi:MAG TPA: hypothetical protein PLW60_03490 [Bacilli bacterium]|nr:hypothetical protein [Bacilli bacterium]